MEDYLHKMDLPMTQDAITVSGMPEQVVNWIWEEKKPDGLVWLS